MAALEQEVLEKYERLDPAAKRRVKKSIDEGKTVTSSKEKEQGLGYSEWLAEVDELREQVRKNHGGVFPSMDVVQMLSEIRDEDDKWR